MKPRNPPTLDALRKSLAVFRLTNGYENELRYMVQVWPPAVRLAERIDGRWRFVDSAAWQCLIEAAVQHGLAYTVRKPRPKTRELY